MASPLFTAMAASISESPPSYQTHQPQNSTLSQSQALPDAEEYAARDRECQISREHLASRPGVQFWFQRQEEYVRVQDAMIQGRLHVPRGIYLPKYAEETLKARWVAQGIWRDEWVGYEPGPRWKHEDPYEPESEIEEDTEHDARERERAREASRPFHQFIYQVSVERDRILEGEIESPFQRFFYQVSPERDRIPEGEEEAKAGAGAPEALASSTAAVTPIAPDINSRAYEAVKGRWVEQCLWSSKWGVLPGMTWKHEHPVEELLRDDAALTGIRAALEEKRQRRAQEQAAAAAAAAED